MLARTAALIPAALILAATSLAAAPALAQSATPDTVAPPTGAVPSVDGIEAPAPFSQPSPAAPAADAPPLVAPGHVAPELWRGARVGMSVDQVKALFPDARNAAPMLVTRPPTANAVVGGRAVWAVNEQVFGYPGLATYYFAPTGLLEVVVSVEGLRLRHTRDNVDAAREVRTGLLQYYGKPKVCLDTDRRGLVRLDCRWVTKAVQVGLSYVDYGGLSPSLDVAVRSLPPKIRESGAVFARHGAGH